MKRGIDAISSQTIVQASRVRELVASNGSHRGPVVYWMSRDMRAEDNWALLYASARATGSRKRRGEVGFVCVEREKKKKKKTESKSPLFVCFALADPLFPGANARSLHFMLHGLSEVSYKLDKLNIEFKLLRGEPPVVVADFIKNVHASLLVCDQR